MTVTHIGYLHYHVTSRSRPGVTHVVDMDANEYGSYPACSCERNRLRLEKCHHIKLVEDFIIETTKLQ